MSVCIVCPGLTLSKISFAKIPTSEVASVVAALAQVLKLPKIKSYKPNTHVIEGIDMNNLCELLNKHGSKTLKDENELLCLRRYKAMCSIETMQEKREKNVGLEKLYDKNILDAQRVVERIDETYIPPTDGYMYILPEMALQLVKRLTTLTQTRTTKRQGFERFMRLAVNPELEKRDIGLASANGVHIVRLTDAFSFRNGPAKTQQRAKTEERPRNIPQEHYGFTTPTSKPVDKPIAFVAKNACRRTGRNQEYGSTEKYSPWSSRSDKKATTGFKNREQATDSKNIYVAPLRRRGKASEKKLVFDGSQFPSLTGETNDSCVSAKTQEEKPKCAFYSENRYSVLLQENAVETNEVPQQQTLRYSKIAKKENLNENSETASSLVYRVRRDKNTTLSSESESDDESYGGE